MDDLRGNDQVQLELKIDAVVAQAISQPSFLWPEVASKSLVLDFSQLHDSFATHLKQIKPGQEMILFGKRFHGLAQRNYKVSDVFYEYNPNRKRLSRRQERAKIGKYYPAENVLRCKRFLDEIKTDNFGDDLTFEYPILGKIRFAKRIAAIGYLDGNTFYIRWIFSNHEWHKLNVTCDCVECERGDD